MRRQADRTDHEKVPMTGSESSILGVSSKFLVISAGREASSAFAPM
jgi:hypothetical protein